jgi:hypothetical protein
MHTQRLFSPQAKQTIFSMLRIAWRSKASNLHLEKGRKGFSLRQMQLRMFRQHQQLTAHDDYPMALNSHHFQQQKES